MHRSARSYADEAVKPVQTQVTALELNLAQNYVRHCDLDELKVEQKRTTTMLTRVLINVAVIASKLKVQLPDAGDRRDDEG